MSWIKPAFGEDDSSGPSPAKSSKKSQISKSETENTLKDENKSNWLESYKPTSTKELVVDTTKIKELEHWLEKSKDLNSTSKLLLLIGPPGSGKATTLNTICKNFDFRLIEWINPLNRLTKAFDSSSSFEYPISAAQIFKEHIFRAARYNSCLLSKHVFLVKDFPNVLFERPSVLHDIFEDLYESLMIFPVVFICNKTPDCNELFPKSMKRKFSIHTITFNPITEKRVYKVLKTIMSHRIKTNLMEECISDNILSHISYSCQGDLRNAIGRLYLKSLATSTQVKNMDNFVNLEPVELTTKDHPVDFFHGLGRVLYPKRTESNKGLQFVHSVDTIVENFESEPGGFLSQLHENYPSRIGDIKDLSEAAGRLATSDLLKSRWQDRAVFNHYSLAVAVRGLMVHNRTPQKARFEAFRKSHTSRMEVDNKALELEGKTLFFDMGCASYLVDLLPFSEVLMSNLNQEQMEYVDKTCGFKKMS